MKFSKKPFSHRNMFDYVSQNNGIKPTIKEKEKQAILKRYPKNKGSIFLQKDFFIVCGDRTEYRHLKLCENAYKVDVYDFNKNQLKDMYFLVKK